MNSRFCCLMLALVASGIASQAALAHNPRSIYHDPSLRWPAEGDQLPFMFNSTVPKGRWRTRITAGALQWNRLQRRVQFIPGDPDKSHTGAPTFKCPTKKKAPSIIYRTAFSGKRERYIGLNLLCRNTEGTPLYFRQLYNADTAWWTDPNSNGRIPSDRYDLWAAASHEMGHATGWGPHYDDDGPDDGGAKDFKPYCRSYENQETADDVSYTLSPGEGLYSSKQTMCYATTAGSTHQRGLGVHDRGTFSSAFGPQ